MRNQEQDKMFLDLMKDGRIISLPDERDNVGISYGMIFNEKTALLGNPNVGRSKNRMFQSDETLPYKGKELSIYDLERELERILGVSNVTIIK